MAQYLCPLCHIRDAFRTQEVGNERGSRRNVALVRLFLSIPEIRRVRHTHFGYGKRNERPEWARRTKRTVPFFAMAFLRCRLGSFWVWKATRMSRLARRSPTNAAIRVSDSGEAKERRGGKNSASFSKTSPTNASNFRHARMTRFVAHFSGLESATNCPDRP